MCIVRLPTLLAVLALAAPAPALASIDHVPVAPAPAPADAGRAPAPGWRTYQTARPAGGLAIAGVSWAGAADAIVELRGVAADGAVTPWYRIDAVAPADVGAGRHASEPLWLGRSVAAEVRSQGDAREVVVAAIDPGPALAPAVPTPELRAPAGGIARPAVVSRKAWGADESLRRSRPSYAPGVLLAVVHHTSGRNDYTPAEAPLVVRGIYEYHTRELGWNDIGYNALVDRYGTVYEGRAGGLDRNVIGAHALGFNTGTFGISLMGDYEPAGSVPPPAQLAAAARMLAWRLDVAHVDPHGDVEVVSGGSERWAAGRHVRLATISGHRDTGYTDCPGQNLYDRLPALRDAVAAVPGLRILDPTVAPGRLIAAGGTPRPVRLRARLDAPAGWRVEVLRGTEVVAQGRGNGVDVDWTWTPDAEDIAHASALAWRISAGSARPASGRFDGRGQGDGGDPVAEPPPPVVEPLERAVAEPPVLTPNGDGNRDAGVVRLRASVAGTLRVLLETDAGRPLATLASGLPATPGADQEVAWDGAVDGAILPSGRYRFRVRLTPAGGGDPVQLIAPVAVRRELDLLRATPAVSPNGDGRLESLGTRIDRREAGPVTVQLVRGRRVVRTLATSLRLPAGTSRLAWEVGDLPDGAYEVQVLAAGAGGTQALVAPFAIDRRRPIVDLLANGRDATGLVLRLTASEPVRIWLRSTAGTVFRARLPAGPSTVIVPAAVLAGRHMRLYARDLAELGAIALHVPRDWT